MTWCWASSAGHHQRLARAFSDQVQESTHCLFPELVVVLAQTRDPWSRWMGTGCSGVGARSMGWLVRSCYESATCKAEIRLHNLLASASNWSTSEVRGATLTTETEGRTTSITLSANWAKASKVISPDDARTIRTYVFPELVVGLYVRS